MIPGKLYSCPKVNFLIYPSIKKVSDVYSADPYAWSSTMGDDKAATRVSAYWSVELKCKIYYSKASETFMCVEVRDKFVYALFGEVQGWIVMEDWLEIESVGEKMPWIIENTAELEGKKFVRKAPGNYTMYVPHEDATVYRSRELAEKECAKHDEFFSVTTGGRITNEEYDEMENWKDIEIRPVATFVLHEIDFSFLRSEKYSKDTK